MQSAVNAVETQKKALKTAIIKIGDGEKEIAAKTANRASAVAAFDVAETYMPHPPSSRNSFSVEIIRATVENSLYSIIYNINPGTPQNIPEPIPTK